MPKKDWLSDKEYRAIYSRVPRLCIDLIIRSRNGVVLSKRDIPPDKGMWHLPGGRVRMQEKLEDAIQRIAHGETGLNVRVMKIIGAIEYRYLGAWGHSISIAYLVKPVAGKLRGSKQARNVMFFKSLPKTTEPEVKTFLLSRKLIRK